MARKRITKTDVERLTTDAEEARIMDSEVPNFGVRVRSGTRTTKRFFIRYRIKGKRRLFAFGTYGILTVEKARTEARRLLGMVAAGVDPIEQHEDEADIITVGELCDRYMKDALAGKVLTRQRLPKRRSTLEIDGGRLKRHVIPLLGKRHVPDVTTRDIQKFHDQVADGATATDVKTAKKRGRSIVRGGTGTAARTIGLLGGVFSYAVRQGYRSDNPVTDIQRIAYNKRNRALTPDEYALLGRALDDAENSGVNAVAIAAIRFVALTGLRKSEALSLKHQHLDRTSGCIRMPDSKTGTTTRPVGAAGISIIPNFNINAGLGYVFPSDRGEAHLTNAGNILKAITVRVGLHDVSLHVLRHSYSSAANNLGYTEATISGLLGHSQHSTTSGYIHHVDRALVQAADRVSAEIASYMSGVRRPL